MIKSSHPKKCPVPLLLINRFSNFTATEGVYYDIKYHRCLDPHIDRGKYGVTAFGTWSIWSTEQYKQS